MIIDVTEFTTKSGRTFPVLRFKKKPDDKYSFCIGVMKLKAILENLDAARNFVDQYEKKD